MMKAVIVLQTLWLAVLPIVPDGFNFSLPLVKKDECVPNRNHTSEGVHQTETSKCAVCHPHTQTQTPHQCVAKRGLSGVSAARAGTGECECSKPKPAPNKTPPNPNQTCYGHPQTQHKRAARWGLSSVSVASVGTEQCECGTPPNQPRLGLPQTQASSCLSYTQTQTQTPPRSLPAHTLFGTAMGKVIKDRISEGKEYEIKTVVIDAGHGGHDPGCLGSNSREKHLALGISLHLAAIMRHQYPDIEVILTRDKDVFVPLHERAAIANRNKADLFMSIHCNFMPGSSATHGSETFVMGLHTANHNLKVAKRENAAILLEDNYEQNYDYDPNSPEGHILLSMFQNAYLERSILFAERIEHRLAAAERKSRGVKQAGFVVLKETAMPSVLIEAGFLSNAQEEAFLMDEMGQQTVATAILQAFSDYKATVEGKVTPRALATADQSPPDPSYPPHLQTNPRSILAPAHTPSPQSRSLPDHTQTHTQSRSLPDHTRSPSASPPATYHILTPDGQVRESSVILFNVQLAASPKPIDTTTPKWRDTGYLVEVVQENGLYKYQARNFSSMQAAFEARLLLQAKGFSDAFLVAYKNGQRISMEEARRELEAP